MVASNTLAPPTGQAKQGRMCSLLETGQHTSISESYLLQHAACGCRCCVLRPLRRRQRSTTSGGTRLKGIPYGFVSMRASVCGYGHKMEVMVPLSRLLARSLLRRTAKRRRPGKNRPFLRCSDQLRTKRMRGSSRRAQA